VGPFRDFRGAVGLKLTALGKPIRFLARGGVIRKSLLGDREQEQVTVFRWQVLDEWII